MFLKKPKFDVKNQNFILVTVFFGLAIPVCLIEIFPEYFYRNFERSSYLIFHNFAEIFSVMVSFSIFGVGYFSYSMSKNFNSLFLSLGFFAVGLIDFFHTLGYAGMPNFVTNNVGSKSTQYWLFARLMTAIVFLSIGIPSEKTFLKKISKRYWLGFFILIPIFCFVSVTFYPEILPITYIPGVGVTSFKRNSEYIIVGLLLVSFVSLYKQLNSHKKDSTIYYLNAIITSIYSGFIFSNYSSVFDSYNILGHIYKIFAFYLIYRGIFIASIRVPYVHLAISNEQLKEQILKNNIINQKINKSLEDNQTLIRELFHRTKNSLQLVRSLLVLQASEYPKSDSISKLVDTTSNRIFVMALVQDMLYANEDLSQIKVGPYIETLCKNIFELKNESELKINFSFEIGEEYLLLDTAIPLGLFINELLAIRFEVFKKQSVSSEIKIQFRSLNENCSFLYSDNWENEKSILTENQTESLAEQMLNMIAKHQMKGKIEILTSEFFQLKFDFPKNLYVRRI